MVQWLGTLAAPLEDLGLILGIIHSGSQLSVTPGGSDTLCWAPQAPDIHVVHRHVGERPIPIKLKKTLESLL